MGTSDGVDGRDLTPLEEEMVAAAGTGELLDWGEGPFSLTVMQAWGDERTIRAAVLRHLLVAGHWPVDMRGVRLRGVRITGHLDLEAAVLRRPVSLQGCYLDADEAICFDYATASRVALAGCHLAGLKGRMLRARELDLSGSILAGPLQLSAADIPGSLSCRGAQLTGHDQDGDALIGDGMKVGSDVFLDGGFTAAGAVWLPGAAITGQLSCRGAQLTSQNQGGNALDAGGMKVGGDVFLDGGFTAAGAVRLPGAAITGQLSCRGAQLTSQNQGGNALVGDGMKVGGNVFLDGGFTAAGAVRLPSAAITGQLSCRGAQLTSQDQGGNALVGDGMKVGAGVFLDRGFTAAGAVRLPGADITGQLNCRGAKLTGQNQYGDALDAGGMKVGDVFLDGGFSAAGAVRLHGADITGQLNCGSAQLTGHDQDGDALIGDGMKVGGDVFLDRGFTPAGAVRLPGADITGQLNCRGAQLTSQNQDGNALDASGMRVGGDVFLDGGLTAAGTFSLNSAHVGGSVSLRPAALAGAGTVALTAAKAQIVGHLRWVPGQRVLGRVNLEGATVGELDDDWSRNRVNGYWPIGGLLSLDGFIYGRFGGDQQATVEQRLAWIRSQYQQPADSGSAAFGTQPYEQLAAVYRQAGQDDQARKVAIARRADPRKYGKLNPYRRFGNWFLDWTIKYGYQTWRAAAGLAAVFVVFLVLSIFAQRHHAIVPIGEIDGLHSVPSATQCTSNYPCFYPAGYTVDTVIPIINVHQADYWGPDGNAPWGWVWVGLTWVATAAGWALATLLVAGYTGLVRQD